MSNKAATDFLMSNIHYELIYDTKLKFYSYKKRQDFEDSDQVVRRRSFKLLAAQIDLIASLLNAYGEPKEQLLRE